MGPIGNNTAYNGKLKLESTSRSIAEIESIVESLLERYKIERDLYPNILISLTEAVTNAINHGNCRDRSKYVHIETRCEDNELLLRVKDEGKGFNPECVPDPTRPGNIETTGGRGVLLIKHFCHEAHYMDHGRTLEMKFKF